MRQFVFILSLMLGVYTAGAQSSDALLLKKGARTIRSFYSGTTLSMTTTDGRSHYGLIEGVYRDTLRLVTYVVERRMTSMGFYILDTAGVYHSRFHYREIRTIWNDRKNFNWAASGYSLLGGGTLLTLASGVVYLVDRDKFSPELMATGAGLALVGYFLASQDKKRFVVGKKYRLQYLPLSTNASTP